MRNRITNSAVDFASPGSRSIACAGILLVAALALATSCASSPDDAHGEDTAVPTAQPEAAPPGFTSRSAEVNGARLHYFIGGQGSPVVLLHGFAETAHMWLPLMPALAKHHTVL